MVRKVRALAIVLALLAALFSSSTAHAAPGDYLKVDYLGGGICFADELYIPVHISAYFAETANWTNRFTVDGVVYGSGSGAFPAGSLDFYDYAGGSTPPGQTIPYAWQVVLTFNEFVVTINGVCHSDGSEPTVSIADSIAEGRAIPAGFELRWLSCSSAVFDAPGGKALSTGEAVWAGQSWFVNPKPVKDASGKSWTEIFASGAVNGYIPTSCVQ
ncbi:MAG: hypothetical protein KF726_19535 [Anaerolineae bacterium]|nr:hypothetical protein [Anaerolineae bacterium]